MSHSIQLRAYMDFMNWFEASHPALNEQYWQYIIMPTDDKGVGLNCNSMDPIVAAQLKQIQQEYYQLAGPL